MKKTGKAGQWRNENNGNVKAAIEDKAMTVAGKYNNGNNDG